MFLKQVTMLKNVYKKFLERYTPETKSSLFLGSGL